MEIKPKFLSRKGVIMTMALLIGSSSGTLLQANTYTEESLIVSQTGKTIKGVVTDQNGEPLLFLIGLFMLLGDRLNLPQFGFQGNAEGLVRKGGWGALIIGALFALAFCPTSGVFYFGMLIPMSATATAGYLLPVVFAIATAILVLVVAWILAFSVQQLGSFYGKMQKVQKWMNRIVGVLFIVIGIYYSWIMYL